MKKVLYSLILLITSMGFSQDVLMENGTFNRCAPDIFYDSGGEFGNYGNDENFTTTICPQNADEFTILDFYEFSTQLGQDIMTIYDGDDTSAPVIGTYNGAFNPGFVSASDSNTSGCLTISFVSNATSNTFGWAAEILCGYPCQDITASIASDPEPNGSGVISILPGDTVNFTGSAIFSEDDTDATYSWNFSETPPSEDATGVTASNTYNTPGTYVVTLTVTDNNPQGCTDTETITVFVLGPNIVVDEDSYTATQLIEDILINSPCATVSNITSSTGIDFGQPQNGIGYFISDGVNFPFEEGILLSSGDASDAEGPNNGTASSGIAGAWPGDPDLDAEVGINSNNASYIQFDFVPLANSISFDFLMASEEYNGGSFECTFSDAFAFLLTDSSGNTTNLAIIPGTTTPILVTEIHEANASCGAVNEQYFGGYIPSNGPPIKYDGRTVVFTAQSPVIPGEQYSIKLVLADATDAALDSGVFLKAGSFDLGGNLGDDITIANGTAGCLGDDVILDTGLTTAVHTWYKDDVEIPGETSSTLTVTENGIYRVDFDLSGVCQGSADPIEIEFRSNPTIGTPQNLYLCELGGSNTAEFDLSQNTSLVLDGQDSDDFLITYHPSQQDAIDNLNALPTDHTNTSNPQTIWVRIADTTDFCYETAQFDIVVTDQPTINPVGNLEVCDDDSNDGVEEFDLSVQDLVILGTQPDTDFNVTYHLSFADADAGTGELPELYSNGGNPESIYVRVENANDPDCYNATVDPLFELIVNPRAIANEPSGMEECDDISNDGVATFDLSSQEVAILDGQDSTIYEVSFHATQGDAEANQSPLPDSYTGSDQEIIYVRVEDPAYPDCYGTTSFVLTVNPLPEVIAVPPLQVCDDDTDNYVAFTLTDKTDELLNGQTGVELSFHSTPVGADMDTDEIFDGYIGTDETIYVRLVNPTTNCYNVGVLNLEVLENPIANPTTPLEVCDDDNDGFAEFDLTLRDAEVIGAQTGMVVSYHANPGDAETGDAPLPSNFTNTDPDAQEIYVRIENATTECYATTTLQLIVNPIPTIVAVAPYELCDYDNPGDELEIFDLTTKDVDVLNGQVNVTVDYYESQADVDAGNAITGPYTNLGGNPQEIIAVLTNTNTGCTSSTTFDLIVNPLPALIDPTPLEVCDDGTPDGITEMDLSIKNTEITGGNPNYAVSYYDTLADAEGEIDALPILYTNEFNNEIIYVRVEDTTTDCYDTTTMELIVQQAPIAFDPEPLRFCDPDNDGFGVFDLTMVDNEITGGASGLTVSYHETLVNAENNVDAITNTSAYNNIVVDTQMLYARVESATIATNCATIVALQLIIEYTPQLVAPTPLEVCDDISADGFAIFDLTTKNEEILNGQPSTQYEVSYYTSEANAEAGNNPITNPNAYNNTEAFSQILWVRVEDTSTVEGCYKLTTLELIVNSLPVLVTPPPLELCDVNNPDDEQEAFILEEANEDILNGQTGITLTYYESQADAENGINQITSPYVNTSNAQTIFVRAENNTTGCYNTVTMTLRVNPIPSPEDNPTPIEVCDDDNDGFAEFNLDIRTEEITNGEDDVVITYHETMAEAHQGSNAITGLYTNIVEDSQMIYVRSENTITGCYSLTLNTLELIVLPTPEVPLDIEPYIICDGDDDGIAQFDLTTKDDEILGTQNPTEVVLTYHISATDAENGNNPIINVGSYISSSRTIYVRLYNPTTGCQDTGMFDLQVELPPVAVQPTWLSLCDDFGEEGDEVTIFDLTVKDSEITGGNASWSVDYYETLADALAQVNVIADPTQYINTSVNGLDANPQTLYAVVTDTDTGCVDYTTLTIRVLPNPTPTPSEDLPDLELCDDVNTGDGIEVFDLTEREELILNFENGVTATYYESYDDAFAATDAIVNPEAYTNVETPEQEIYVRVTKDVTGCFTIVDFTIRVNPLPDVVAVTDFIQCELNTDGIDSFDLTSKDDEVLNGQNPSQFIVTYHESLVDAQDGINALVSPYINTSSPQQIFVTITNNVTGCSISTQSFYLEVHEGAEANSSDDPITYELCDDNMETDGDSSNDSVQFDLTVVSSLADLDLNSVQAQILDGQDPEHYIVSYYETATDADLAVDPLPTLYENNVNPQVIYARVDNNTMVVGDINLDLSALTEGLDFDGDGTIDTYDNDNDGTYDLVDVDGDGISDATDTTGDGLINEIDTNGDGIADFVDLNNDGEFDNQEDSSICYAVAPLTLWVNPLPLFDLDDSYTLCIDTNGTEILDPLVIDTYLSDADYTFEWSYEGAVIAGETGSSIMPGQGGTYSVIVTNIATGCENIDTTTVVESAPPSLELISQTQAFAENHVIEVLATGIGEYEYSLDDGPWQDSGVFSNVSPGSHEVTARDKMGCGITTIPVDLIGYPPYFTPNGDGNHDTWNITGIESSAKIYIFDRYGKLVKQISPSGSGWDGTFNGNLMPSSDYWFTVEYVEPTTNEPKEFKAHFTLKR